MSQLKITTLILIALSSGFARADYDCWAPTEGILHLKAFNLGKPKPFSLNGEKAAVVLQTNQEKNLLQGTFEHYTTRVGAHDSYQLKDDAGEEAKLEVNVSFIKPAANFNPSAHCKSRAGCDQNPFQPPANITATFNYLGVAHGLKCTEVDF